MDELERSSQLLREALDELSRQGMVTAKTFAKLNQATLANTAAQQGQTQAVEDAEKSLKKLYDTTKQVIGGFLDTAQQARANREDFTSLNPAIRSTGVVFGKGAKTVGSSMEQLGHAITGAGLMFGPKGALIGLIAGSLVKGLGTGIKAAGEETGKLLAEYGTFITGELQRVVTAFQQVASVGAIGAEGMQGFANMAVRSGLSMEQFAGIVAKNGEALAATGGTTLQGAQALVGLTEASVKFEDQFLKMGIGFTEQRDFYAKFLNQNRLILRMQITDQNALAESAKRYIENIDELARLTGIQRSEAQSEIERQNADIRLQAQKQVAMARGGETLVKQIEGTVGYLEKRGGRTLSEGFADAMTNTATEASKQFAIATGGLGPQIARDLFNNRITQEEAIARVRMALDQNAAMSPEIQSRIGKLGTVYDSMYNDIFRFRSGVEQTTEGLGAAKKEQKGAQNAQDQLTDQTVKAQKNLQNFAQQLDMLVVKNILPNAAKHVEMFTRALSGSINYINDKLGIKTPAATGGGRGGGETGAAAPEGTTSFGGTGSRMFAGGIAGAVEDMVTRGRGFRSYTAEAIGPATSAQDLASAGLTIKQGDVQAAGSSVSPRLIALAKQIQSQVPGFSYFSGFNDRFHQENAPASAHTRGLAADFTVNPPPTREQGQAIVNQLKSMGFAKVLDEYNNPSAKSTAGHFHAAIQAANGGVFAGPRSGYNAVLHGTEAIVPLPDGRKIPVEMTGMTDKMGQQIDMMNQQITSLNELVGLMRTNNDINNKILRTSMN